MAWVVPALIAAGVAAGAAGLAHDIKGFVSGETPWDDPGKWVTGALKAGAIGFGTGFLGGAAGAALGPALGGGAGAAGGGGSGGGAMGGVIGGSSSTAPAVVGPAVGGATGGTTGSALGDAAGIIGSNTGTVAAEAGAATPQSVAGILPQQATSLLGQGTQGPMDLMREALSKAAINAGTGAAQDRGNPLRGALVGAAGSVASSGLNFAGQATGILPRVDTTPNYQPMGDTGGYSPDSASIMPPQPSYAPSPMGPSLGTRAMGAAGQLGVKAGTMGVKQFVGNAMTPPPPGQPMGTYQSFGIQPYFERAPYA